MIRVPVGSVPVPVTVQGSQSGTTRAEAVSWLTVSVPVLSVAIMVHDPSDSIATSRRTTTCRRAIRRTATARATVSATGSPSGIAETASATATRSTSCQGVPRKVSITAIRTATAPTVIPITAVKRRIRLSRGGSVCEGVSSWPASEPNTLCAPTAVTAPRARP